MAKVELSLDAVDDLDSIFAFGSRQFGYNVADDYHTALETACDRLTHFPELGPVYPGLRPPIRFLSCRRHHIFYRFDGETVLVVRILHHAMNAPRQLRRR